MATTENYHAGFRNVVERCITGELTKEVALKLLESRCSSVFIDEKKAIENCNIVFSEDEAANFAEYCIRSYCWGRYGPDTPAPHCFHGVPHNDRWFDLFINANSEAMSKGMLDNLGQLKGVITCFIEKNIEIAEMYDKCKTEIKGLTDTPATPPPATNDGEAEKTTAAEAPHSVDQQQKITEGAIAELVKANKAKMVKKGDKTEYQITGTVPEMWCTIDAKRKMGTIGDIGDTGDFIKAHLTGKKGNSLADTVRLERKNHEK
jgi:hypothetical protein